MGGLKPLCKTLQPNKSMYINILYRLPWKVKLLKKKKIRTKLLISIDHVYRVKKKILLTFWYMYKFHQKQKCLFH